MQQMKTNETFVVASNLCFGWFEISVTFSFASIQAQLKYNLTSIQSRTEAE